MIAHRVRLDGVEYLICDAREPKPRGARRLADAEFRRLLSTHAANPRIRAVLRELGDGRLERGRVTAPTIDALRCYELEATIPRLSAEIIEPGFEPPVPAVRPPVEMFDEQPHWVEVRVVGEDDQAIAGVLCEITLASGKVVRRTTDRFGLVRIEGILTPGACTLSLPDLDQDAWDLA